MTETIRDWLIGIIAAAMLLAVTGSFTPAGTIRKIGRLTGGLVMMLAMLRPVAGVDLSSLSASLTEYRAQVGAYEDALQETNEALMKVIIEERTGAYILERANALGIKCTATVLCKTSDDGTPYPYEAVIEGDLSPGDKTTLLSMLEGELAIPKERVYWKTEETAP